MEIMYNLGIHLLAIGYQIAALFNEKARLFIAGRTGIFNQLSKSIKSTHNLVWIHCASLGEFEQSRPVIESIKEKFPGVKILLTFFSPSGYENKKDYDKADFIFYLPWDKPKNAKRFIEIIQPVLAIFVKYEFWYHYSNELKKKNIPLISVSCILRPDQVFFKPYGGLFRKILSNFNHFFAQNQETVDLLARLNINATLAGDTRFDRVYEITQTAQEIGIAKKFKNDQKLFVAGSCWPADMDVLYPMINENPHQLKFIIAPHEISESFIKNIENSISAKTVRYSQAKENVGDFQVLIIDNIGLLSKLYRYGEFAYVGGAFGDGLHNILEAACYGVPIFFGNKNYKKYQEANDLIMRGGAFEVADYSDLKTKYQALNNHPENFLLACEVTKSYVKENLGATQKVLDYCTPLLNKL